LVPVLPITVYAQHGGTTATNPFTSAADRAAGAVIYKSHCAACHGLEGRGGGDGPDLTSGRFRRGSTNDALFQTIANGVPGTTMRAFALSGREIWQVITHIRSLVIARSAESAKGNPKRGQQVFEEHGCRTCHVAGADGGITGPDLNGVALRRTLGELERSVLQSNDEVLPDYWSIRARTKTGQNLTVRRLNEDTFSLQLLDANGKLFAVMKADLAEYEVVRTSPMPSFAGKFQGNDFEDLLAYLASLKEN
jgi:putative heme-binding domain-containing protein